MVIQARENWLKYVKYKEYKILQKQYWKDRYEGMRCVM